MLFVRLCVSQLYAVAPPVKLCLLSLVTCVLVRVRLVCYCCATAMTRLHACVPACIHACRIAVAVFDIHLLHNCQDVLVPQASPFALVFGCRAVQLAVEPVVVGAAVL